MVSFSSAIFKSFSMQSLQYAIKSFSEVFCKGIAEDIFEASIGRAGLIVFTPARGKSQVPPVCCLITCPGKSPHRIDKGLKPYEPMAVDALPVTGYPLCNLPEKM